MVNKLWEKILIEERRLRSKSSVNSSESSDVKTAPSTPRGEGKLKKDAEKEGKLRNAKAVILILTPDFEQSDDCKNDVNLSYSYRKVQHNKV